MPLPRPISPLLAFLQSGMSSPPFGGPLSTPLRPALGNVGGAATGSPTGAGTTPLNAPLAGMQTGSPFPALAQPPRGGILADTLPNLRLETMREPNWGAMSQPVSGVDPLAPKPKRDKGKLIGGILGAVSDGLLAYGGLPPQFGPALRRQQKLEMEDRRWREKLDAEIAAKREAMMQPRFEQIANTGGMFDPSTMSYQPIFTAPQPFELYARSLGYQPGTPEYIQAIEDYRAGTWGDEGVAGRLAVQQPRLQQSDINNRRSTGVSRENNIRSTSTSRGNNIRSTAQSNTNSQRTAETTRGSASYQGRGRGSGARAVAANGEPIIVKGGRWVYEKSGQPVN